MHHGRLRESRPADQVDMNKFDSSQVRKSYHKMVGALRGAYAGNEQFGFLVHCCVSKAEATFVHPDKLGREPTDADRARTAVTFLDGLIYRLRSMVCKTCCSRATCPQRFLKRPATSHCQ